MPNVRRLLVDKGTTFSNHTITLPTCCPSRVTFLRGQYPHNHKIGYGVRAGEVSFRRQGHARSTVGTWLNKAGYRTGYIGKYLNDFSADRYSPPGWDRFYANVDQDVWSRKFATGGKTKTLKRGNIDAHLADIGVSFLKNSGNASSFLWLNFNAPHQLKNGPPPAPERDLRKFGSKMPRSPAFNESDVSDKPSWIRNLPKLTPRQITSMGKEREHRLASLQVVDRGVAQLIDMLERTGELDNTYIFFTSDNGYHMGEHRMGKGKMTPYLTDVRVPLIVRGPGVARGVTSAAFVQNTDFAPTAAEIAGEKVPDFVDGRSMLPLLKGSGAAGRAVDWREQGYFEGRNKHPFAGITTTGGLHYVSYDQGPTELYDLNRDPHQLENLAGQRPDEETALRARLRAIKDCKGESSCRSAESGPLP